MSVRRVAFYAVLWLLAAAAWRWWRRPREISATRWDEPDDGWIFV